MPCTCKDCNLTFNGFDGHMVMLTNSLWRKVSNGNIKLILCDQCIEKRLQRSLSIGDLKQGVPCNIDYIQHLKQ